MSGIFKKYDVRGIYPEEFNEERAAGIAKAFLQYANENFDAEDFVIAHDARTSSPSISNAIINALVESGANVFNLGMTTTPCLNFSVAHYNRKAGIIVTASHNPKEYNGMKLIGENALQLYGGKGLSQVEEIYKLGGTFRINAGGSVIDEHDKVINDYTEYMLKFLRVSDFNKKFAVEFFNGVGAITLKPLFEKAGIKAIMLNEEPNGMFPKHNPNPLKEENLEEIKSIIKSKKLDFGVAFDGDGDRFLLIDEQGNAVRPDIIFGLLCSEELKNNKRKTVYVDPRFSKGVVEELKAEGANVITLKVGNPFYKEALHDDDGALAAAEFSGHIMFKENYGIDDALFVLVKFLNIVENSRKTVSELVKRFKKYFNSGEINIKTEKADFILSKLEEDYKDGKILKIDGLRVDYDDWWFIVRKSNTEPVIRLIIEAKTRELLLRKKDELVSKIVKLNT